MTDSDLSKIKSTHPLYRHWNNLRLAKTRVMPNMCPEWAEDRLLFFKWCLEQDWQAGSRFMKKDKKYAHSENNTYIMPSSRTLFGDMYMYKNCSLNGDQVAEIRKLLILKVPQAIIADKYNVSVSTISNIHLRRTWAHIE
jgi:hypothetical protein